jgi:hypothetical protein
VPFTKKDWLETKLFGPVSPPGPVGPAGPSPVVIDSLRSLLENTVAPGERTDVEVEIVCPSATIGPRSRPSALAERSQSSLHY